MFLRTAELHLDMASSSEAAGTLARRSAATSALAADGACRVVPAILWHGEVRQAAGLDQNFAKLFASTTYIINVGHPCGRAGDTWRLAAHTWHHDSKAQGRCRAQYSRLGADKPELCIVCARSETSSSSHVHERRIRRQRKGICRRRRPSIHNIRIANSWVFLGNSGHIGHDIGSDYYGQ